MRELHESLSDCEVAEASETQYLHGESQHPQALFSRARLRKAALCATLCVFGLALVEHIGRRSRGLIDDAPADASSSDATVLSGATRQEWNTWRLRDGIAEEAVPIPIWTARGMVSEGSSKCFDAQKCVDSYSGCSVAELACASAVRGAMSDPELLDSVGMFRTEAWYPKATSEPLRFRDYQNMVYLHDQACLPPCLPGQEAKAPVERSEQTFFPPLFGAPAAPAAPEPRRLCPPHSDGLGMDPRRPPAPKTPLHYNGVTWPGYCFEGDEEEHVLLIGDWGGVAPGMPADQATGKKGWSGEPRVFVNGIDNRAQFLVARELAKRAAKTNPKYVLNVGDNFYWGGCQEECAAKSMEESVAIFNDKGTNTELFKQHWNRNCSHQFYSIFETMYMGPGLDGKPWISTLGNHDYGGCHYWAAWDQQIAYTWGPSGRWVMPGLYYHVPVAYPAKNFTIDYFVLDSNVADTGYPEKDPGHNICGKWKNEGHSCAPFGPSSAEHCVQWFKELWLIQAAWLRQQLMRSVADWQIVVTHFPPETCVKSPKFVLDLRDLGREFGIDLIIAGHRHQQAMFESGNNDFTYTAGIPYVVTGGGGGITSDGNPGPQYGISGLNMYGFMDMTVTKKLITIEAISETGQSRGFMKVYPRSRHPVDTGVRY